MPEQNKNNFKLLFILGFALIVILFAISLQLESSLNNLKHQLKFTQHPVTSDPILKGFNPECVQNLTTSTPKVVLSHIDQECVDRICNKNESTLEICHKMVDQQNQKYNNDQYTVNYFFGKEIGCWQEDYIFINNVTSCTKKILTKENQ